MSESLHYYIFAKANLLVHNNSLASLTQLRTVVLIVLFELFTSNARFAFDSLYLACNTTVRLGLCEQFQHHPRRTDEETVSMQNLYWVVLYLDSYICGVLNEHFFFDISKVKSETLVVMQHAAKNTAQIIRSPQKLLLNVGLALSIELFDLQKRIAGLPLYDVSRKAKREQSEKILRLRRELDDFKVVCDAIFPPGEVVTVVARFVCSLLWKEGC